MPDARRLLAEARHVYDDERTGLRRAAHGAACSGFAGGAAWMRLALGAVRGMPPAPMPRAPGWQLLGLRKYTLALGAALLVFSPALFAGSGWALLALAPVAVLLFYAVEVRMVFAFPLALDGSDAPLVHSHRLLGEHCAWGAATVCVMRLAFEMLSGGLRGRGFVRSWCVGCLGVVLWYEHARVRAAVAS